MQTPSGHNFDTDSRPAQTPPIGGGRAHELSFEIIQPHIISGYPARPEHGFKYVAHIDSSGLPSYPGSQNFIHTQIPLELILPHLSKQSIHGIASLHQVQVASHALKSDLQSLFDSHSCVSCKPYFSVFLVVDSKLTRDKTRKSRSSHIDIGDSRPSANNDNPHVLASPHEPANSNHQPTLCGTQGSNLACAMSGVQDSPTNALNGSSDFLPNPADPFLTCDISQSFCEDSAPQKLEEPSVVS
jgi:hypothetical protein